MGGNKSIFWALLIVSALMILTMLAPLSAAVGIVLVDNNGTYEPGHVDSEYAAINYEAGIERLAVALTIPPSAKGIWLIALPSGFTSAPLGSFPMFGGKEVDGFAQERLNLVFESILGTQAYPLSILSARSAKYNPENWALKKNKTVEDQIYAVPVSSDMITGDKFKEYFAIRYIKINQKAKDELQKLADANYSFALVWLQQTNTSTTRGIVFSFETDKPYYPAKLSSLYREQHPRVVYYLANVLPTVDSLQGYAYVKYLYLPSYAPASKYLFFGNSTKRDLQHTKIEVNAPSILFQEDWRFQPVEEKELAYQKSWINHPFLWGLLLFSLLSCLASMLAGSMVFWDSEPRIMGFFFFGLNNLMSLPWLWTAAYIRSVDESLANEKPKIDQRMELTRGQRVALAIPGVVLILSAFLVPVTLFLDLGSIFNPIFLSNTFLYIFLPGLIFLILILYGIFQQGRVLLYNVVFTANFAILLFLSYMGLKFFI